MYVLRTLWRWSVLSAAFPTTEFWTIRGSAGMEPGRWWGSRPCATGPPQRINPPAESQTRVALACVAEQEFRLSSAVWLSGVPRPLLGLRCPGDDPWPGAAVAIHGRWSCDWLAALLWTRVRRWASRPVPPPNEAFYACAKASMAITTTFLANRQGIHIPQNIAHDTRPDLLACLISQSTTTTFSSSSLHRSSQRLRR